MNQINLYKKIIDNCDEALREAFIHRMNIAENIASTKIKNGMKISDVAMDEENVQRVTFGVPRDIKPMAVSLWRSLSRMNRGRQYSYCMRNTECVLSYDEFLTGELPEGTVICPSDIAPEVSSKLGIVAEGCTSTREAITRLAEGKCSLAAVKTGSFYDTAWLYSMILDKNIFVSRFELMEDGSMIALLSDRLVASAENTIITVAFSIVMDQPGDIAQKVSIFAEAGMNIEYLAVKTQGIDDDDRRNINIVFCELSGGGLSSVNSRSAFMQLENECEIFRILGSRKSV
ncbi:MAG: chorismate mutase [Clostridia bacterium]|nr:chorismate mutase [Clostridia bacterium]